VPKKVDRVRGLQAIGGPGRWNTVKRIYVPAVLLFFDHNKASKRLPLRERTVSRNRRFQCDKVRQLPGCRRMREINTSPSNTVRSCKSSLTDVFQMAWSSTQRRFVSGPRN